MSRDSYAGDITRPLSLNRYTYTENNPVNYTDPSGKAKNRVLECNDSNTAYGFIESEVRHLEQAFEGKSWLWKLANGYNYGYPTIPGVTSGGLTEDIRRQFQNQGFECFEYNGYVWDMSSYGNVMFGLHMKQLGAPMWLVTAFGHADQFVKRLSGDRSSPWTDPLDDQSQMRHGYYPEGHRN